MVAGHHIYLRIGIYVVLYLGDLTHIKYTTTYIRRLGSELVTLLIDRVVVDDEKVEIRYVIPASPAGEEKPFCHLRSDYRGDAQRL